ncbi:MAG TPA: hypothetical protein VNZ53_42365 [Steroidobacteraceae bacterium]|jgi:hypothetical protein|nr:hypothetical protein [Steroidobacteraceae bacterium]
MKLFSDTVRREMSLHERVMTERMLRERERLVYDEYMRGNFHWNRSGHRG